MNNPTPTPNVVRNPTPPKNLRLRNPGYWYTGTAMATGVQLSHMDCSRVSSDRSIVKCSLQYLESPTFIWAAKQSWQSCRISPSGDTTSGKMRCSSVACSDHAGRVVPRTRNQPWNLGRVPAVMVAAYPEDLSWKAFGRKRVRLRPGAFQWCRLQCIFLSTRWSCSLSGLMMDQRRPDRLSINLELQTLDVLFVSKCYGLSMFHAPKWQFMSSTVPFSFLQ